MKPVIKLYAGLITACCMLFAGSLYAGKAPTVDICHWDDDTGAFKLKQVNGNAQKAHLGHGDEIPEADPETTSTPLDANCELVVNPPAVIARAYINVDKQDGYDGDGSDIPIVEVLDVDGNSTVSSGDVVRFGQFPKDLGYYCEVSDQGCYEPETITPQSLTVDQVEIAVYNFFQISFVETAMKMTMMNNIIEESVVFFSPSSELPLGVTDFRLIDWRGGVDGFDSIFSKYNVIHTGAWCDECVDNYFIDVDFY